MHRKFWTGNLREDTAWKTKA